MLTLVEIVLNRLSLTRSGSPLPEVQLA